MLLLLDYSTSFYASIAIMSEAVFDLLCEKCQNLFARKPNLGGKVRIYDSQLLIAHHQLGALLDSAKCGCHLCSLMLYEFGHSRWDKFNLEDQIWVRFNNLGKYELKSSLEIHTKGTNWSYAGSLILYPGRCK